jgi:hypothetical protein
VLESLVGQDYIDTLPKEDRTYYELLKLTDLFKILCRYNHLISPINSISYNVVLDALNYRHRVLLEKYFISGQWGKLLACIWACYFKKHPKILVFFHHRKYTYKKNNEHDGIELLHINKTTKEQNKKILQAILAGFYEDILDKPYQSIPPDDDFVKIIYKITGYRA